MEDKIKIVNCGCGGEVFHDIARGWNPVREDALVVWHRVICKNCGTQTKAFYTETEAIQAWTKAMGAKDINVPNKFATDTNVGNKTAKFKQDGKFLRCGKCNHMVDSGYKYCPECGSRLEFE